MHKYGPVIDMDTHVGPGLDVLKKYADEALLSRWSELDPYINVRPDDQGKDQAVMRVNPIPYERQLRQPLESGDVEALGAGGLGSLDSKGKALGKTVARGTGKPRPGVQDEDGANRLLDMDAEGVGVHLLIPGTWALASTQVDGGIALGLYESFHRYMEAFAAVDDDRLKGCVLAPAIDPEWAARQIRSVAGQKWVAGAIVLLPENVAVDDPSLDPIWAAMADADLPIVYHSFFYEPPYFPGYRDIWGNLAVARAAAHPWGAQRILAHVILSGLLDEFPNLRIGFSETGAGWLPYWLKRLEFIAEYLPSAVPTRKKTAVEYAQQGQVFCGIQFYEGADMAKSIIDLVGEDVLMFQTDYPHGECEFPDSVKKGLSWAPILGESAMAKFMGGNAQRFLRLL